MEDLVGGWSETMDATEDIQMICDQVKLQVEKLTGVNYREFIAKLYRNQIVKGGQNYVIKVYVGEDYNHLSLYRKPDGEATVRGVLQHKTKDDALEPFPI